MSNNNYPMFDDEDDDLRTYKIKHVGKSKPKKLSKPKDFDLDSKRSKFKSNKVKRIKPENFY